MIAKLKKIPGTQCRGYSPPLIASTCRSASPKRWSGSMIACTCYWMCVHTLVKNRWAKSAISVPGGTGFSQYPDHSAVFVCTTDHFLTIYAHMCKYHTGDRMHGDTMPEPHTPKTSTSQSAATAAQETSTLHTCLCGEIHPHTPDHASNRDTCTSPKKFGASCCCSIEETESETPHCCGHKPRCH